MSRLCFPFPLAAALATTLLLAAPLANAGDNAWSEAPSPAVNGTKAMVYRLVNSPTSASVRFAGTSAGVFKSTNGGATWSASNSGITPTPAGYLFINDMVIDPGNGNTLYISPNFLQKSTDAGATWVRTGWETENPQALLLAIDPLNPTTVWTAANRGIYKTTNGGTTWSYVTGTVSSTALTIDPSNPSVLYRAVSGSGIFKTSNGGVSWDTVNTGLTSLYVISVAVDPKNSAIVYAGTLGSGVFKSTNGGSTWTASNTTYLHNGGTVYLSNKSVYCFLIDPANSAVVVVGTSAGIFRSQDGGAHWSEANNGAMANISTMVFDAASPSTIIAGNQYGLFSYTYPTDADRVFNWAESLLGRYFPAGAKTQTSSGITLRYYPTTDIYLGTLDGVLYVYGTAFGGLRAVGSLASFLEAAAAAGF